MTKLELTSEQKHKISAEINDSDLLRPYETVPLLNNVLKVLGYSDYMEDDSEREELRWTKRKEPLIKDEKIRKAVRAWAEANDIDGKHYFDHRVEFDYSEHRLTWIETGIEFNEITGLENLVDGEYYTIAELCGEEAE